MKLVYNTLILLAGALMTGCTSFQGGVVLAPVGPVPGQTAASGSGAGSLVVYSAYDVNPDFNSRDNYRPRFTDYRILTEDGQSLKFVHNDSGTFAQSPVPVKLPAGKYRVIAHANGRGQVTVPVIIATSQLTTVHLESNFSVGR